MTKDKKDAKAMDETPTTAVQAAQASEAQDVTAPADAKADDGEGARDHTEEATADVVKDETTTDADKAAFDAALAGEGAGGDEAAQPPLDVERIKQLIEKASQRGGVRMMDLLHQLEREEGLTVGPHEDGDEGPKVIEMAGVKARASMDIGRMLDGWCNAARRALLQVA